MSPIKNGLSTDQRAILADLWREVRGDPRREADLLTWCNDRYTAGDQSAGAAVEPAPLGFHIMVDILTNPRSASEGRSARAAMKRMFRQIKFE